MTLYQDSAINIYFGDSSDDLFMSEQTYSDLQHIPDILSAAPFSRLSQNIPLHALYFPRQIHCTMGYAIDEHNITTIKPFWLQGDYLITHIPNIGLGILTADCLPVVLHDPVHSAIAAIHAGWRGAVAGIVVKALEHLGSAFGTTPGDIRVFFGPCAKQCCYTVGPEILQAIEPYKKKVIITHDNQHYFDLPTYNRLLLEHAGVQASACCNTFAQCTICNHQYCSYRRQQSNAGRQLTVVSLK